MIDNGRLSPFPTSNLRVPANMAAKSIASIRLSMRDVRSLDKRTYVKRFWILFMYFVATATNAMAALTFQMISDFIK